MKHHVEISRFSDLIEFGGYSTNVFNCYPLIAVMRCIQKKAPAKAIVDDASMLLICTINSYPLSSVAYTLLWHGGFSADRGVNNYLQTGLNQYPWSFGRIRNFGGGELSPLRSLYAALSTEHWCCLFSNIRRRANSWKTVIRYRKCSVNYYT